MRVAVLGGCGDNTCFNDARDVMPGPGPGIHDCTSAALKTWMAGPSPAMTAEGIHESGGSGRHGDNTCFNAARDVMPGPARASTTALQPL